MRPLVRLFSLYFLLGTTTALSAQAITIDLSQRYQTIVGFGAVGGHTVSWEPGPHMDQAFVDLITRDLGATIMRLPIDPAGANEPHFALVRAVRAAHADDDHKFIASVWTPPGWMKLDADDSLAVFCRDHRCGGRLNPNMREEFAEYLVAYVRAFKQATGAELYALSIQNELLFPNAFDSCVYSATEYAETLKVVGARFAREHLKTRLFGPEHMGSYRWNDESGLLAATLDDPAALRYLDAYAVHSYVDGVSPDFGSADGWSALFKRVHAAGKPLWMSETSRDEVTFEQSFDMARALHLALKHGHVSAWVYWTYAKHLFINKQPTDLYYLLKSYFRYVRPGSVQVEATADDRALLTTAFTEPDALTVVVINNSNSDKTTAMTLKHGKPAGPWQAVRTSRTEHSISLGVIEPTAIHLPPMSITTLVSGTPGGMSMSDPPLTRDTPLMVTKQPGTCGCNTLGTPRSSSQVGLYVMWIIAIGGWCQRRITRRNDERQS